jgi:hypothetical protein
MATVSDPRYQAALQDFCVYYQGVHRAAGEPPYSEVARACRVSITSVHRYLNGIILPPWRYLARYLDAYGDEITRQANDAALTDLKTKWMAVRDVRKPIGVPNPNPTALEATSTGNSTLRRLLAAVPDSETPDPSLRRLA